MAIDNTELKIIADGLALLGKPGRDDRRKATARLALMERFTRLVAAATPADRHDLVAVLKDMLADASRRGC